MAHSSRRALAFLKKQQNHRFLTESVKRTSLHTHQSYSTCSGGNCKTVLGRHCLFTTYLKPPQTDSIFVRRCQTSADPLLTLYSTGIATAIIEELNIASKFTLSHYGIKLTALNLLMRIRPITNITQLCDDCYLASAVVNKLTEKVVQELDDRDHPLNPTISEAVSMKINSVLGSTVLCGHLTYTLLVRKPCEEFNDAQRDVWSLEDFEVVHVETTDPKKPLHLLCAKMMLASQRIPEADAYVLPSREYAYASDTVDICVQQSYMRGMMQGRLDEFGRGLVYTIKDSYTQSLFAPMSKKTLDNDVAVATRLMKGKALPGTGTTLVPTLAITEAMRRRFFDYNRNHKGALSPCLLSTLAFCSALCNKRTRSPREL